MEYGQQDLLKDTGLPEIFSRDGAALAAFGDQTAGGTVRAEPRLAELAADIEKLGPTFIRLGQLLSLRPDLLPLSYIEALAYVGEPAEPMEKSELDEVFQSELQQGVTATFQHFDYEPMSRSVFDQAHKAVMRDGRRVVVKVQRPNVREQVHKELDEICEVAEFFDQHIKTARQLAFATILDEFRKIIFAELDYREELHNLKTLKQNLREMEHIIFPESVERLCTSRVLTLEYIEGTRLGEVRQFGLLSSEKAALAGEMFQAYLQQFLVDGFVHSDPRPSNFLFTKTGKIAVLDTDIVTRISHQMQEKFIQLIIALNEGRAEHVADLLLQLGSERNGLEESAFRRVVADLILLHRDVADDRLEVGRVFLGIDQAAVTYGLRLPSELAVLGNTLISLDKITDIIDQTFDSRVYLQKHVTEIIRGHMRKNLTPAHVLQNLTEAVELLEKLPSKVGRILDSVANNELAVTVHAVDETVLISGFQKIANRITIGLVLASLIIGAAMLMNIKTRFTIWGYPGLAIICFLLAAGCGFTLVLEVLIKDRHSLKS